MRQVKFTPFDVDIVDQNDSADASSLIDPSSGADLRSTDTISDDTSSDGADLNSVVGFDSGAGGPSIGSQVSDLNEASKLGDGSLTNQGIGAGSVTPVSSCDVSSFQTSTTSPANSPGTFSGMSPDPLGGGGASHNAIGVTGAEAFTAEDASNAAVTSGTTQSPSGTSQQTGTAGSGTSGGASGIVSGGSQQSGLVINVSYDASCNNAPAAFKTAVAAVVSYYESQFTNPITISIDVGYGEVDGRVRRWTW